jgi:DNA polymerase I-like protein with 3'-5' exonuclease and polymerase domains
LDAVDEDGYIQAQIAGLTNTLRFKHKTAVNLPGVDKPYGKIIRGALTAPEGYELCGSDMSSLEDRLKQHYIWPHDPDFVKEMMKPGFDPHLDLALAAGVVTEKQVLLYKSGEDKSIAPARRKYKTGNYALQYQCGVSRLALSVGVPEKEAQVIYNAYWKRNWAIKEVAKEQEIKTVKGQMWLKNPINGFWYSLRYEKDIFSTLVQGSASYVFDLWVQTFREKRPQLTGQFHDEVVLCVKKGFREQAEKLLRDAIAAVNNQLKLNRELGIDVQFGARYSDIH